jgi:hypothetical protein
MDNSESPTPFSFTTWNNLTERLKVNHFDKILFRASCLVWKFKSLSKLEEIEEEISSELKKKLVNFHHNLLQFRRGTTGIAFFAECLRHSTKAILHSANNTRQTFYRQRTLPNVEKHSTNKSTRQIKNRKKPKNSKTFI